MPPVTSSVMWSGVSARLVSSSCKSWSTRTCVLFDLSVQVVIRCIARVSDAYKLDKKTKRTFKPLGSIAYDERILSWNLDESEVSIWTMAGRERVGFVCRERDRELLAGNRGKSKLC